jgi:signal transduction histidine kinase
MSTQDRTTTRTATPYAAAMGFARGLRGAPPVLWDVAFYLALVGLTWLAGNNHDPITGKDFTGPAYLLSALIVLPFAGRRHFPMTALVISTSAHLFYFAVGYHMDLVWWGPVIGLYFVIAHRPRWMAVIGSVLTVATVTWSGVIYDLVPTHILLVQTTFILVAAWLIGNVARAHVERGVRLARLTDQLRREQQARERRAVAEEQVRIARELHDVVAHHMSVISVQAGLAQYVFATDPPTARAALDTVAAAGREAQQEMQHLLTVLRPSRGGATGDPFGLPADLDDGPPGLARFDDLADRVRAAGLPVTLTIEGEPESLPVHLDLCAYRIVQESLTNALKHAGPAHASVTLRYGPTSFTVTVVDDGRAPYDPSGAGHGLLGMRERARLYGGTFAAGPDPAGGFTVTLTLPLPVAAPASEVLHRSG